MQSKLLSCLVIRRQLLELEKEAIEAGVIESPSVETEPEPPAETGYLDHPLATP